MSDKVMRVDKGKLLAAKIQLKMAEELYQFAVAECGLESLEANCAYIPVHEAKAEVQVLEAAIEKDRWLMEAC